MVAHGNNEMHCQQSNCRSQNVLINIMNDVSWYEGNPKRYSWLNNQLWNYGKTIILSGTYFTISFFLGSPDKAFRDLMKMYEIMWDITTVEVPGGILAWQGNLETCSSMKEMSIRGLLLCIKVV